jgi:hypothetical protein
MNMKCETILSDLVDRYGISVSQMTTDMSTQWPNEKAQKDK